MPDRRSMLKHSATVAGLLCLGLVAAVLRPGDVGDGLKLPLRTSAGHGVGILWLFRREADPRYPTNRILPSAPAVASAGRCKAACCWR